MVAIALQSVGVRLGGRGVLRDFTATLTAGHLTAIIGPNGAGKSTLLRATLGLLPLAEGAIHIDDKPLADWPPRTLAQHLAYLPQGQNIHWPISVERLVALGRLPHLAPLSRLSAADDTAIADAMARADVAHLRQRAATSLSGGEKARVLLARALATGAAGLVADEPLLSLDPGHQIAVMQLLRAEADRGALVIIVLHDLMLAARYCDRLILLDRGRLVVDGPPAGVLTPEHLAAVYGIRARIDLAARPPLVTPLSRLGDASA